jgi:hypothetical protein
MIARLARFKVYAQRAMQYLAFPQAALLLDLSLKAHGKEAWFFPLAGAAGVGLVLFGWLERKSGLAAAETEYHWSLSPQLKAIVSALDASEESAENP